MKGYQIGDKFEKEFVVTEKIGQQFADVSGDYNPIHLDEDVAAQSRFKKRIVHGMLIGGYISGIIGNDFPGNGTIYLKQDLKFMCPVFYNETIKICITIKDIDENKNRLTLTTQCFDENAKVLVDGQALVMVER